MMKYLNLILISGFILLNSCKKIEGHEYIKLVNNSDNAIIWQHREFYLYPEDESFDCRYLIGGSIESNSYDSLDYDARGTTWEAGLNTHYLQIIVMERDLFLQYNFEPCDTIQKYLPILHRYVLTVEDLERMNWTIVYPPTEL